MQAAARVNLTERVGAIAVPTLVIATGADRTVLPASTRMLATQIRDVDLIEYAVADHRFEAGEGERWCADVAAFLERVDGVVPPGALDRRHLVEAAWHHRARYAVGSTMRERWELAPAAARIRGDEGNRRLHQRWVKFIERRKRPTIANVAIACELAGWSWSLAVMED